MTDQRQHSNPSEPQPSKAIIWSKRDWWLPAVNAILVAAAYLIFDSKLPDQVASHFDINGKVNNTMAKGTFWLFYAGLTILLPVVVAVTRSFDPRRANYEKFLPFISLMRWTLALFLQVLFISIILHETGSSLSFIHVLQGALGVLWMLIGNRMGQVKSNFFIGIRTPWALSSDANWNRTHRFAARIWFVAGLVMFLLAWFVPVSWTAPVVIVGTLGSAFAPVVYSYLLYRRGASA